MQDSFVQKVLFALIVSRTHSFDEFNNLNVNIRRISQITSTPRHIDKICYFH